MGKTHDYKRLENSFIQKFISMSMAVGRKIFISLRAIWLFLIRRYTVVFVPHSEKRVYNLRINILSILCFLMVTSGIIGSFFWFSASYNTAQNILSEKENKVQNLQASLDQLRDEVSSLLGAAKGFEYALSDTLSALGVDNKSQRNPASGGDFGSLFNIRETPADLLAEVDALRRIVSFLDQAQEPIGAIGPMLVAQNALLTEIPSIWPVKDGRGQITMFFGQNINPFSGQYYIHKGIDICTFRSGDPIVATADGQIVTIEYSEDFGNYIIIQHKHGYYTRYAHLLSARARLGQWVQQGEVIGYIGNTGLSTGPHLHYEVHIGSDVVDPYKYINIRSSIAKQGR